MVNKALFLGGLCSGGRLTSYDGMYIPFQKKTVLHVVPNATLGGDLSLFVHIMSSLERYTPKKLMHRCRK